jgi:hypothetical protein
VTDKNRAAEGLQLLRSDFPTYAKHCVRIRTKDGEVRPFILNRVQLRLNEIIEKQYNATGKVRVVILKARQQGLSTYTSAWIYWRLSQLQAKKGLVVAHKADSTKAIFGMYQRIHKLMPPTHGLKPTTSYSGRKELVFSDLDTGVVVATAGGDDIGRGETLTHVHCSEHAFWQPSTASENWNALLQAVPNTPETAIVVESTANGITGIFADLWRGAVDGTNGFIPFFSPWFDSPEYALPVDDNFLSSPEEEKLIEAHGLTFEQLAFRRQRIALNGRDAFLQEYPATADEAFITTGRPVFVPEQINDLIQASEPPLCYMALEGGVFEEHSRGELAVYRERDTKETYTIGADVAGGQKGGDFSVAQVLDSDRRQVAVWRGQVDPEYFATVLQALGFYFNTALVAVERNNNGLLTAVRLGRDLAYPNMYKEVAEGKMIDDQKEVFGFYTSARTKPLIIDRLRATLRERDIEINDATTLKEMQSYVLNENGGMEAERGCYDDCVIALALANHLHQGKWTPIVVTDDYYVDAL